jgi:L-rhamnose mutarotase
MTRYCFTLQVRADHLERYVERHRQVWPEMLRALNEAGWRNYSLFLRGDGLLVGVVESDDLDASLAAMASTEVNARWQAEMAEYFAGDGKPADQSLVLLREVFHLPSALADAEGSGPAAGER